MIQTINNLITILPVSVWQIAGAFVFTQIVVQSIKLFEPIRWSPHKRRKINLGLSMLIGGGAIAYLYDQQYKGAVIVAFMFGNNFLYSGLAELVRHKAEKQNGFWTVLNAFFRPYLKNKKHFHGSSIIYDEERENGSSHDERCDG